MFLAWIIYIVDILLFNGTVTETFAFHLLVKYLIVSALIRWGFVVEGYFDRILRRRSDPVESS